MKIHLEICRALIGIQSTYELFKALIDVQSTYENTLKDMQSPYR